MQRTSDVCIDLSQLAAAGAVGRDARYMGNHAEVDTDEPAAFPCGLHLVTRGLDAQTQAGWESPPTPGTAGVPVTQGR